MNFRRFLFENTDEFLYHSTPSNNINSIIKNGLQVSKDPYWGGQLGKESFGKIYLSSSPEHALYYGLIRFKNDLLRDEISPIPILLRIKKIDSTTDNQDKKSSWISEMIPQDKIEMYFHRWQKLNPMNELDYEWNEEEGFYQDWEGEEVGERIEDVLNDIKKLYQNL